MSDQRNQCSHPGCNCATQQGSPFCSDYCRDNAATTEVTGCGCKHPDCGDKS